MQTELLEDFLHLYHGLAARSSALPALLSQFDGDPAKVRKADPKTLGAAGLNPPTVAGIRTPQAARVARDLAWAASPTNHLICFDDPDFPPLLRETADFPALLYASGDPGLLRLPQIAIVGSRHCTPSGAQTAFEFAGELSAGGMTITSGMAYGIDSQAHRGALEAGGGTIAVTGTGIDIVYPARNQRLAEQILRQGLLVSEFPLGCKAQRHHFPQRNRIISGLSLATLVVEAAERSGSLITARLAAEQGREVFAVPGSIHNPQARGCHRLIRDGASLAQEPRDLLAELAPLLNFAIQPRSEDAGEPAVTLDKQHLDLLQAIGYEPVHCDILVQRSGLTIEQLSSMLLLLELNDYIQSAPGGCFVRI